MSMSLEAAEEANPADDEGKRVCLKAVLTPATS